MRGCRRLGKESNSGRRFMQRGELSNLFPNVLGIKQRCSGIVFMDRCIQSIVRGGAQLAAFVEPGADFPCDVRAPEALPRNGLESANQGFVHAFSLSRWRIGTEVADRQCPMIGGVVRPIDRQAHSHFVGARRSRLRFRQKRLWRDAQAASCSCRLTLKSQIGKASSCSDWALTSASSNWRISAKGNGNSNVRLMN